MKTTHPSDHDIQQYIFDVSECTTVIIAHISSCSICKMRAERYVSLSHAIKEQPEPSFDFDVSERVLQQLVIAPKKEPSYDYFTYALIALSIGIVVFSLYLFKDIFMDLLTRSAALTYFIISIMLLISMVLCLDMLRSFNKKMNILNY